MDKRNMLIRTLSGAVYIALIVASLLLGGWYTMVVFCLFAMALLFEYYRIGYAIVGAKTNPAIPTAVAMVCVAMAFIGAMDNPFSVIVVGAWCMLVVLLVILTTPFRGEGAVMKVALEVLGAVYAVVPFLIIAYTAIEESSRLLLLLMFILLWANDTFAYLAGSMFGRHKMVESISPKKSWEGFAGGALGAIIIAIVSTYIYDFGLNLVWTISFALTVVVSGTLGDLFESQLKRTAGIKDSGRIMPGHGGLLDRLDSALFAIPAVSMLFMIKEFCF